MTATPVGRRSPGLVRAWTAGAMALAAACSPPDAGRPDFRTQAYLRVVEAEDARHVDGPNVQLLASAAHSTDPWIRAAAVRGLGRLETPTLTPHILPSLDDADPRVRAEAANALAQAHHRGDGFPALTPLMRRVAVEEDPGVRGVVARSLGRLALPPEDRRKVARVLIALSRGADGGDAPRQQLLGVVLGMESFTRSGDEGTGPALVERIRELTRHALTERVQNETMARVRRTALLALGNTQALTVFDVEGRLRDPAEGVRQAAAARLDVVPRGTRPEFIRRILRDPSPQVRLEGVRALARGPRDALACTRLLAVAEREMTAGVRVAALDALSEPCPQQVEQVELLGARAEAFAPGSVDWHEAAHALVSLAALDPAAARALLPRFAAARNPFVRVYAARAAASVADPAILRGLAADADPNVQGMALTLLARREGRGLDTTLVQTLREAEDPQLVLRVVDLLEGTRLSTAAADAALATLERFTDARMQTLADARLALLAFLGDVGDASYADAVEPYIRDDDARVARSAASLLRRWTGRRFIAAPRPSPRLPLPTSAEIRAARAESLVFHIRGRGSFTVRLRPDWAATNAVRAYRLARNGVFDGLTFHRVVPNFVIQGGSPGANEYAGHGGYTRDEVGLPVQWRGTVGLSTRGRDTGDGQLYVNLVDNPRLDHDYTIFGQVTSGLDVVDRVMEGDVIERVEIRLEEPTPGALASPAPAG